MIIGVGTDIIEIARVAKASARESFLQKCFSADELLELGVTYVNNEEPLGNQTQRLAGRWAAKEAVAKALGTGFTNFGPSDVEILAESSGKPVVRLHGNAKRLAESFGNVTFFVSISHCSEYASAVAVAEIPS